MKPINNLPRKTFFKEQLGNLKNLTTDIKTDLVSAINWLHSFLLEKLGDTDISAIGDGTVTGAISQVNSDIILNSQTLGYTKKNLLKNSGTAQMSNGVTFTVNNDGSVVAENTATTNNGDFFVIPVSNMITLPKGEYIVSGCPKGGSEKTYLILVISANDDDENGNFEMSERWRIAVDYGNSTKFTLLEDTKIAVVCRICMGYEANGTTFFPMIRNANIVDDTYESYYIDTIDSRLKELEAPIYTEATSLQKLVSGEKLSVAFGKIAKLVGSAIAHFATKATLNTTGHVKLSDSSAVTNSTGFALPATEKNAAIEGTLAHQIREVNSDLQEKSGYALYAHDKSLEDIVNSLKLRLYTTQIVNGDNIAGLPFDGRHACIHITQYAEDNSWLNVVAHDKVTGNIYSIGRIKSKWLKWFQITNDLDKKVSLFSTSNDASTKFKGTIDFNNGNGQNIADFLSAILDYYETGFYNITGYGNYLYWYGCIHITRGSNCSGICYDSNEIFYKISTSDKIVSIKEISYALKSDLGDIGKYHSNSKASVELASNSWGEIAILALEAGVWVIDVHASFSANTEGQRIVAVLADGSQRSQNAATNPPNGNFNLATTTVYNATEAGEVACYAYQSSGSTLKCSGEIRAVRIK